MALAVHCQILLHIPNLSIGHVITSDLALPKLHPRSHPSASRLAGAYSSVKRRCLCLGRSVPRASNARAHEPEAAQNALLGMFEAR